MEVQGKVMTFYQTDGMWYDIDQEKISRRGTGLNIAGLCEVGPAGMVGIDFGFTRHSQAKHPCCDHTSHIEHEYMSIMVIYGF